VRKDERIFHDNYHQSCLYWGDLLLATADGSEGRGGRKSKSRRSAAYCGGKLIAKGHSLIHDQKAAKEINPAAAPSSVKEDRARKWQGCGNCCLTNRLKR